MDKTEVEIIRRIRSLTSNLGRRAVVGIGDDAAVIKCSEKNDNLFTTDTLVEGIHFKWEFSTPRQVGWKALAVNISDIAAMGGSPTFFLVTLGFPPGTSSSRIDEIYKGMEDLASRSNTEIIGGDIVRSPVFFITISLLGEVEVGRAILRSGARPGDTIYLTGDIGASGAGFLLLNEKKISIHPEVRKFVTERHLTPSPRLREGRRIQEKNLANCMIDVSDGLTTDLHHIMEESKVGAEIYAEKLPVAYQTKEVLLKLGKSPLEFAIQGGEDYELLFTSSRPEAVKTLGFSTTEIGRISEGKELFLVDKEGKRKKLEPSGWDHFRFP